MAKKQNFFSVFLNGLITENPTFVLMLGLCPTVGVTTAGSSGLGMGLATTAVLVCSNLFISMLRNFIPEKVRIPSFIVIIASFVTIVDLFLQAFLPDLSAALGSFVALIVVNCIVFARAEAFAFKNKPLLSISDGLGMGLGFTGAITILSVIREVIGAGTCFGIPVIDMAIDGVVKLINMIFGTAFVAGTYQPMTIMVQPAGGFIALGLLLIVVNVIRNLASKKSARKEAA
ncbi:MAG: electron transport complex subunit E [Clostridiales bacterium]|nr:electron transport complex subunit E [Clostridiales bacterium]